ncbi:two-component system sensor histidine kinase NtrB [Plasticicumulans acidivorans]|uniref:histidine kinase n=1 Tax=Plasticicumulans acidivorans TaxID=886464 RepID=A0A317MV95_9GAMM|nr:PAS domain-containing sensor histidine kinase [Plasticicumulans acidivorans]PWV61847.1 sensor protein PilS [Plasticicumulans acidivorans]
MPRDTDSLLDRRRNWQVYRAYILYRLVIAALLLAVALLGEQGRVFGARDPSLFWASANIYFFLVAAGFCLSYYRHITLPIQAIVQAFIDIGVFAALIYTGSGGSGSLGALLVSAIAGSAILLPRRLVVAVTALSCLTIFAAWFSNLWEEFAARTGAPYFMFDLLPSLLNTAQQRGGEAAQIITLCLAIAGASTAAFAIAERTRRNETLVNERTHELLQIAELNAEIIRHLQSGIVVVDRMARVTLMNQTAAELLDFHEEAEGRPLSEISPELSQRLAAWLGAGLTQPRPFRPADHLPELIPEFTPLSGNLAFETMVFLEDSAAAAQRLQQIKLAALGRLTASIAHEIRNPLASISHAAQLLAESTANPAEKRLGKIIFDNAGRASRIISNVLDLSRRDKAHAEDLTLHPWLEDFCREFMRGHGEPAPEMEIRVQPDTLRVSFDSGHLRQVLWNLCDNACEHGTPEGSTPRIRLLAAMDAERHRPYIEVIDEGAGIPEPEAKKIFEPFFTTNPQGTGLGLYIARELCEANRAQLQYLANHGPGSRFRITLPPTARTTEGSTWKVAAP